MDQQVIVRRTDADLGGAPEGLDALVVAERVKAAGGVRDLDGLLAVRALGVSRCGASRTKEILDEGRRRLNLPPIAADGGGTVAGY